MNCPHCHTDLDDGDIYERLRELYPDKTGEEIREWAGYYGWTPENKERFSRRIGIYDRDLDRTVRWRCPDCGGEWGGGE